MNTHLFRILRNRCGGSLVVAGMLMPTLAQPAGIGTSGAWMWQDRAIQQEATEHVASIAPAAAVASAELQSSNRDPRCKSGPLPERWQPQEAANDMFYALRREKTLLKEWKREASLKHRGAAGRKHAAAQKAKQAKAAKLVPVKDELVGVASFYKDDIDTASGEKFNPREMTAAHRTLPFNTCLRVTDLDTGNSVMVRINDRGPYIRGRIVDLSASAAERLGIAERGIANVKLELVN